MPTLTPATRLDNIERSLNVYIEANIKVGMGLVVIYPRSQRTQVMPAHWVMVDYQKLAPLSTVWQSGTGIRGALTDHVVVLNIFEKDDDRKAGGGSTVYTLPGLASTISDFFSTNATVSVRDYAAVGTPVVGSLRGIGFPDVLSVPTPIDAGITQLNISARLQYVAESID